MNKKPHSKGNNQKFAQDCHKDQKKIKEDILSYVRDQANSNQNNTILRNRYKECFLWSPNQKNCSKLVQNSILINLFSDNKDSV